MYPKTVTETLALAAARAEGRAESAEELTLAIGSWLAKFAEHVGGELDDVGRRRFLQFRAGLSDMLATRVEDLRREKARAIDAFVSSCKIAVAS